MDVVAVVGGCAPSYLDLFNGVSDVVEIICHRLRNDKYLNGQWIKNESPPFGDEVIELLVQILESNLSYVIRLSEWDENDIRIRNIQFRERFSEILAIKCVDLKLTKQIGNELVFDEAKAETLMLIVVPAVESALMSTRDNANRKWLGDSRHEAMNPNQSHPVLDQSVPSPLSQKR